MGFYPPRDGHRVNLTRTFDKERHQEEVGDSLTKVMDPLDWLSRLLAAA